MAYLAISHANVSLVGMDPASNSRKDAPLATDEVIDLEDVQTSPRGRKPNLDDGLVKLLKSVPSGKAIRLGKTFGNVAKDQRSAVSATIRKHWKAAHGENSKPRIDFTSDGVAQVRNR